MPGRSDGTPMGVSVVLPCLDEAESVGACTKEALDALAAEGLPGEVVVVDNGSTDGSAEIAEAAGARVVYESRPGYGSALRAGFSSAKYDIVVMADADLTYPLDKIGQLVRPVLEGEADLVLGSRLDDATRHTMPFLHRYVGTPAITWLTARACGGRVVSDSQSGYRAFRRDQLPAMNLQGTGMELATEMLIRSSRAGLRISEVHTGYRPRVGESKLDTWGDGWRHLQLILMLAPDVLLIGPGAVLTGLGLVMLLLAFLRPAGVEVGSLRWQPVFFSGIALVLGVQALLAGVVLAHNSSLASGKTARRYAFVGKATFPKRCVYAGATGVVVGLVINVLLFAGWLRGDEAPPVRGFGLASLAQSLIIVGGTLVSFGLVTYFGRGPQTQRRAAREHEADVRRATTPEADTSRDG
jgi:glycosyltransferase involved in cell wall biosynthesis